MAPPVKSPREIRIPPEQRLSSTIYRNEYAQLAVQGEKVPPALGHNVIRACVVRGIRLHPDFATELRGTLPIFTRALNARQIMSDMVPNMTQAEDFPYCIWYPNVAKESTYREVVDKYPQMRYQVGRACAVAGYTALYQDLKLLPDVNIAEEARDNGSVEIFDNIMSHKDIFCFMNDYELTIGDDSTPHSPACLNGDTAVRSSLDVKRKFRQDNDGLWARSEDIYFNITEDFCFDVVDYVPSSVTTAQRLATNYLFTPLPMQLPPLQKDILIKVAAYNGDVDRYSRLRRPGWILSGEYRCAIHGIYLNTFFAKWWSMQQDNQYIETEMSAALVARAIMNNDLSRIDKDTIAPYCIWYPRVPAWSTLRLLVARRPDMAHQVARACIVGNLESLYDEIDPEPHFGLLAEAKASANPHYLQHLQSKVAAAGSELANEIEGYWVSDPWKKYTKDNAFDRATAILPGKVCADDASADFAWLYDDLCADISSIELHVSAVTGCQNTQDAISTAFGGAIDEELTNTGHANLAWEYDREAERITGRSL